MSIQIVYQNIGGIKLPAIAGHDKLTHFIYGTVGAAAIGLLTPKVPFATGALIGGAALAALKEVLDYTVRGKQINQANVVDTILDFAATAAGGVLLALLFAPK